jgi:hypothetical protein
MQHPLVGDVNNSFPTSCHLRVFTVLVAIEEFRMKTYNYVTIVILHEFDVITTSMCALSASEA